MACSPNFDSGLNFECVLDIIKDVRANAVTTATVQKGLWVVGSLLNSSSKIPMVAQDSGEEEQDIFALCDDIEALIESAKNPDPQVVQGPGPAAIDPLMVISIIQLLLKLFKK